MDALSDPRWLPLREALEVWAHAIEAVEGEAYRVRSGGAFDPVNNAKLLAAVETARPRCERVSLAVQKAHPDLR